MNVAYHPRALAELLHETGWYERRTSGLGQELAALVEAAVVRIACTPNAFPIVPGRPRFRRLVLSRFPFSLVYMTKGDAVVIIAVAHAKKRPGYWAERAP